MSTKKWDAVDGVLASTAANWTGGLPIAGDNIEFDADSAAHNCTFDLALALGSFTMTADYSGTITQAAIFSVTSYSQAAGTFTGNGNVLTCSGNFVKTGGAITYASLTLTMTGDGTTLSEGANLGNLVISGNVTNILGGGCVSGLTISIGKTFTLTGARYLYYNAGFTYSNLGTIAGASSLSVRLADSSQTWTAGTINCANTYLELADGASDRTLTLGATATFGGALIVRSLEDVNSLTLDLSVNNYPLSANNITIAVRAIVNGRGSIISCAGTWDSSAGTFTQGTSTLIMGATGNLKCAAAGVYNLRVAEGVTTTLTAALNVYKDLRVMGTLTRGANTVSLLGAGEQTVGGYPDTAITVNSTGPVIFHECAVTHADVTATAGTLVWTGYGRYVTHGNLSISGVSRKPDAFTDVQNLNGTLTFDAEARMKDLITDAGQTTVQSAGVWLGISGKIATAGTFTQNTPTKIERGERAFGLLFPVCLRPVNQPKGWGDA
jgi:hypothetical protein